MTDKNDPTAWLETAKWFFRTPEAAAEMAKELKSPEDFLAAHKRNQEVARWYEEQQKMQSERRAARGERIKHVLQGFGFIATLVAILSSLTALAKTFGWSFVGWWQ